MAAVRILTTPDPDTTQRVQLGARTYVMRIRWSQRGECWHMDLQDANATDLLRGLRMVTLYPLFFRFRYNAAVPPGDMWFLDTRDGQAKPTLEGMGDRFRLYYLDNGQW